jgi:hypothetical protein
MPKRASAKPPKARFILLLMVIAGFIIGLRVLRGFDNEDITAIIEAV